MKQTICGYFSSGRRSSWPRSARPRPGALLKGGIRQATLISRDACLLANGGYVLLDFGRELHGGVDLTLGRVTGGTNASLRITFGESAMEALSHLGEKNATNDHSPRDFSVPAQAMSHFKTGSTASAL